MIFEISSKDKTQFRVILPFCSDERLFADLHTSLKPNF